MDETEIKPNESIDSNNDDDEQRAKEKLNQRREARRKKILDNAKNRLERLNGRTSTSSMSNASTPSSNNENQHFHGTGYFANNETTEFSDPEIEPDILLPKHLRPSLREPSAENLLNSMTQQNMQRNDSETNNNPMDFLNLFATPQQSPPKKRNIFFKARIHLVISALISCLLTLFWKTNGFSIFITPGLCVITDLLFFREPKPLNPTLIMIFMMLDQRILTVVQKYIHLFGIVHSIITDLAVFIFSYCTFLYIILCSTNNRFDDLVAMK